MVCPTPEDNRQEITYAQSGVDTSEGARAVEAIKGAVKSTSRPEVIGGLGGFGGLFSIDAAQNMAHPVLVSGTDGVGTKLRVAQLMGDCTTVGIDLVAMCANDILACGAEPLFFLDYIAIGKLKAEIVAPIVEGIAEGCRQAGCALIGGEMAEHPGTMDPADFDLSGFCVGLVDKQKMVDGSAVEEGDVIIGIASSGIHSNGYSLVRKVCVEGENLLENTYEQFDGRSLGEMLLTPTRIYVKAIQALLASSLDVHGMAHITGGGMTENLDRTLPSTCDAVVTTDSWPVPPVIDFVSARAGLSEVEQYKTFNMGIGYCVIVPARQGEAAIAILEEAGETAYDIGRIAAGTGVVRYK